MARSPRVAEPQNMNVEVCLLTSAGSPRIAEVRQRTLSLLEQQTNGGHQIFEGQELDFRTDVLLAANVQRISLHDVPPGPPPPSSAATVHVHRMYDEEATEEAADGEDDGSVAFQMWLLPSRDFDGLWSTLLFESDIKERLLRYVGSAMRFSVRPSLGLPAASH